MDTKTDEQNDQPSKDVQFSNEMAVSSTGPNKKSKSDNSIASEGPLTLATYHDSISDDRDALKIFADMTASKQKVHLRCSPRKN